MAQNLWPDIESGTILTPVAILREQADLLGQKTKNVVTARVRGGPDQSIHYPTSLLLKVVDSKHKAPEMRWDGGFVYTLSLVAPALDNYAYDILRVRHGMQVYPVQVEDLVTTKKLDAATEQEFLAVLGEVLGSAEVKKVIQVLLAQSEVLEPASRRGA